MNERNTLSMPNIQPAAQDTPLIMPVAKETSAISFEGGNVSLTSYALPQKTPAHLTAALRAAPHLAACANYADTAPEKPLRLIFCAEHLPTAIQAAACLSACHGADEEKSGQKDDVWDDLDGLAEVVAAAFLVDNSLIYAAGGYVVGSCGVDVGESFVVAEVEVGFMAVDGHIAFAVFVWVECAGVDIYVWVKLLYCHSVSAGDEQICERGRDDALAE